MYAHMKIVSPSKTTMPYGCSDGFKVRHPCCLTRAVEKIYVQSDPVGPPNGVNVSKVSLECMECNAGVLPTKWDFHNASRFPRVRSHNAD